MADSSLRAYDSSVNRLTKISGRILCFVLPRAYYKCACGVVKHYCVYAVKYDKAKSCGCLVREVFAASRQRRIQASVGHRKWPEYRVWVCMKRRCNSPNDPYYSDYGGRGITVCKEWQKSFFAFREHVGPRPSKKHTIDRIDNGKGYEPGNVRWATSREQARNKRTTRWVVCEGKKMCLADACEKTGVSYDSARKAFSIHGAKEFRGLIAFSEGFGNGQ